MQITDPLPKPAYSAEELAEALGPEEVTVIGDPFRAISYPASILKAENSDALTFCNKTDESAAELLLTTKAGIIVCADHPNLKQIANDADKTLLVVNEPRLAFIRLIGKLFSDPKPQGIHPTAVIDPRATIHPNAYIGPFVSIGNCVVGEGCIIYSHVSLYSKVRIGKNVIIHSGTVIGADGFGYQRNADGEMEKFPHVGGVVVEDDVEIGANTCVDRGTLGDTLIREGAKIDNLVHIAHNVVVGRHAVVIAHAMIGGSTQIGDYAWVAPTASIRDGISLGDHSVVGLGAVVVKDVLEETTVMGAPARLAETYKALLKQWDKLLQQ